MKKVKQLNFPLHFHVVFDRNHVSQLLRGIKKEYLSVWQTGILQPPVWPSSFPPLPTSFSLISSLSPSVFLPLSFPPQSLSDRAGFNKHATPIHREQAVIESVFPFHIGCSWGDWFGLNALTARLWKAFITQPALKINLELQVASLHVHTAHWKLISHLI